MNALTPSAGGGVTSGFGGGDNPFAMAGSGAGSTIFMKFKGASGDFLYGQDDDEMPHGTKFAAQMNETKWIWSFWWEGQVLENIETFIVEDPAGFNNEPDHLPEGYDGDMSLAEIRAMQADRKTNFMDGWSVQGALPMKELDGDQDEYTLKLNAGVALTAFRALLQSYGKQFRFKEGLVPIIELSARSYVSKNKSVGKRYTPVLKITDWMSEEELMAGLGGDPDAYDMPEQEEPEVLPAPKEETAPTEEKAAARPRPRRTRGNYAS